MNHSHTLRLITQWMAVMDNREYEQYTFINNKQLVSRDVTYFNQLKLSHHYIYYGRKEEDVDVKLDIGREALLERIASWSGCGNDDDNDNDNDDSILTYARNGWKWLEPGWLVCPECGKMLVQRPRSQDSVIDSFLLSQITAGHDSACFWRYYTFDVNNYYFRPYDRKLVDIYYTNLKNVADNYLVVKKFDINSTATATTTAAAAAAASADSAATTTTTTTTTANPRFSPQFSPQFINNSNRSVIDFKENLFPDWVYSLALLNWQIQFNHFDDKFIVWLHCNQCHQKVFLQSSFDPYSSHKPWCCIINNLADTNWRYYTHVEHLVETANEEGINEDKLAYDDINDSDSPKLSQLPLLPSKKRPHQVDIEENLSKLKKLRKFFIVEEIDRTRKVGYS